MQSATRYHVPATILGHKAVSGELKTWGHQSANIFYIPAIYRTDFIALSSVLAGENVSYEMAIPHIMGLLTSGNSSASEAIPGRFPSGDINSFDLGKAVGNSAWLHAEKLSHQRKLILQWWSELTCKR